MLDLYGGTSKQLPNLLNDSMKECEASLEVFVDDVQLGTSDALIDDPCDPLTFGKHVDALKAILDRARTVDLRYKLDKCIFFQLELPTLGMIAGRGVITADPKKVSGVLSWPRPSRPEDIERFLATMVFIREHLTPRFSEVAKPLRDAMHEMQQKRAANPGRSKSKYLPKPKAGDPSDPWPSFWSQECEDAFLALKRAAVHAVELQVPDFVGAQNKTNVFHLWPDACKYGVGAGLFQGTRMDVKEPELLLSAYEVLGLNNWCTKNEIERRYQQIKRQLGARNDAQVELGNITDAYDKIINVDSRKEYDATLGLAKTVNPG